MSWLAVRVSAGEARDAALAALFELGSQGVQEVGDDLVTHFSEDVALDDVIRTVRDAAPDATVQTSRVEAVDWSEEWKRGVRAHDLGAGSAVLAIAAAKLGAAHVVAIEIDHDAIANANENVERNGVASRVTVFEGDATVLLPLVAPVRVVLANILSSVLLELLPSIRDALTADGEAILSGILLEERETMLSALARDDWRLVAEDVEGAWWTARVARS